MINKLIVLLYAILIYLTGIGNIPMFLLLLVISIFLIYMGGYFTRPTEEKVAILIYCFVFYVPLLGSVYIKYQENQDIITIKNFLIEHNCRKTDFEIETSSSGELYNSNIFKCDDFSEELTEKDINFLLNIQNKN